MRHGLAVCDEPAIRSGASVTSGSSTSTSGRNAGASGSSSIKNNASRRGRNFQAQASASTSAASHSARGKDDDSEGATAVKDFLVSLGLQPNLATILRKVGITDRARLEGLGKSSSAALDWLVKKLEDNGLDSVACILVRDGLEKRAPAST
ncbi:hypothetical protein C8Q79DRAFT_117583 [Trametes meyenii]|nr:hypothetical protein C8Q79DRAFT_117583 [Trametes meyenii]